MTLPRTLMQAFDHMDMGVYLEAIGDATLTSSDIIAPGAIHET